MGASGDSPDVGLDDAEDDLDLGEASDSDSDTATIGRAQAGEYSVHTSLMPEVLTYWLRFYWGARS